MFVSICSDVQIESDIAPCAASIPSPEAAAKPHFRASITEFVSRPLMYGMSKYAQFFASFSKSKIGASSGFKPTELAFIIIAPSPI